MEAYGATQAQLEHPNATRYETLFRISQAIGVYRDPRELFRVLAGELCGIVRSDGIGVVQFDDAGNKIKWHLAEKCGESEAVSSSRVTPEDELFLWVCGTPADQWWFPRWKPSGGSL